MPRTRLRPEQVAFARRLRSEMTDAERLVWSRLRAHRLNGLAFRRQVPLGRYVADFGCHAARLVIELDGGQHADDVERGYDRCRDEWLASRGYLVLLFWNADVFNNLDGVVETIFAHATARMHDLSGETAGDPQ